MGDNRDNSQDSRVMSAVGFRFRRRTWLAAPKSFSSRPTVRRRGGKPGVAVRGRYGRCSTGSTDKDAPAGGARHRWRRSDPHDRPRLCPAGAVDRGADPPERAEPAAPPGAAARRRGARRYERLEFLGDRVLGLDRRRIAVADLYPDEPEGHADPHAWHSWCSRDALARGGAQAIGLDASSPVLSRSEARCDGAGAQPGNRSPM